MPKKKVTEDEKNKIMERVKREFPGSKCLQEIHYIRYIMELEWQGMTPEEIDHDIKEGAQHVIKEMKWLTSKSK